MSPSRPTQATLAPYTPVIATDSQGVNHDVLVEQADDPLDIRSTITVRPARRAEHRTPEEQALYARPLSYSAVAQANTWRWPAL